MIRNCVDTLDIPSYPVIECSDGKNRVMKKLQTTFTKRSSMTILYTRWFCHSCHFQLCFANETAHHVQGGSMIWVNSQTMIRSSVTIIQWHRIGNWMCSFRAILVSPSSSPSSFAAAAASAMLGCHILVPLGNKSITVCTKDTIVRC